MPLQTTRYAKSSTNLATTQGPISPVICNLFPGDYYDCEDAVQGETQLLTNLLDRDRTCVWRVAPRSGGADNVYVEFDIEPFTGGAGSTVNAVGVLGFSKLTPDSTKETYVQISYKKSVDTWASPWVAIVTEAASLGRDYMYELATPLTEVGFIQFRFASPAGTPGWTLGKFFIGETVNLGVAYGIGSEEMAIIPRSRVATMDGTQYVTEYGKERRLFNLKFPSVLNNTKNELVSLAKELEAFVLHAPSGEAFECRSTSDSVLSAAVFGVVGAENNDVWSIDLSVESLP